MVLNHYNDLLIIITPVECLQREEALGCDWTGDGRKGQCSELEFGGCCKEWDFA